MLQNNLNRTHCLIRWKVSWVESSAVALAFVSALAASPSVLSAAQAPVAPQQAAASPTNSVANTATPTVVIVGHGPDRPNTFHRDFAQGFNPADYGYPVVLVAPVFVPYFVIVPSVTVGQFIVPSPTAPSNASAAPGPFGRFMSDPMARFQTNMSAPTVAGLPIASQAYPPRDR